MNEMSGGHNGTDSKTLCAVGGVSSLLSAAIYLAALGVYLPAQGKPPPSTVADWFSLFQISPLRGLFFLGLADVFIMILWIPMVLALYSVVKHTDRAWATVGTALALLGIGIYLATNIAFSMLSLSRLHASAAGPEERGSLESAGSALIALARGTGGQYTGMPLAWLGGGIISFVMLRGRFFSEATGWVGILGLGLLIASVPFAGYTSTGPVTLARSVAVVATYIGGGVLSLAWYLLLGIRLLAFACHKGAGLPHGAARSDK